MTAATVSVEQLRAVDEHFGALAAAVPDPDLATTQRERDERLAERHRHTAAASSAHHAMSRLANLERKGAPLWAARDALTSAVEKLERELTEPERELAKMKAARLHPREMRQLENRIADLRGAIAAAREGWHVDGLGRVQEPPPLVLRALPAGTDFAALKPLSQLDALLADLDKRREEIVAQVRPLLDAAQPKRRAA